MDLNTSIETLYEFCTLTTMHFCYKQLLPRHDLCSQLKINSFTFHKLTRCVDSIS